MAKKNSWSVVLLSAAFSLFWASAAYGGACNVSGLEYYTEDFPPYSYKRDGVVSGSSVEYLREAWRLMGVAEPEIHVMPWARSMDTALRKPNGVLFSCARTPERESWFKWVCPFDGVMFVLVGRRGEPHKILLGGTVPVRVGVVRKSAGASLMKSSFPRAILDAAPTFSQNVDKLNLGRVDYVLMSVDQADELLATMEYSGLERVMDVGQTKLCIAFNLNVPDCVVDSFRKAFATMGKQPNATGTLAIN